MIKACDKKVVKIVYTRIGKLHVHLQSDILVMVKF